MQFTVKVNEPSSGEAKPLFVSDYYSKGSWGELFRGVMGGLTGSHHRREIGSKTVNAQNLAVVLTPHENSAAHFGLIGLPSALRVARKINNSKAGLHASLGFGSA